MYKNHQFVRVKGYKNETKEKEGKNKGFCCY